MVFAKNHKVIANPNGALLEGFENGSKLASKTGPEIWTKIGSKLVDFRGPKKAQNPKSACGQIFSGSGLLG